jgi:hypothetical protein
MMTTPETDFEFRVSWMAWRTQWAEPRRVYGSELPEDEAWRRFARMRRLESTYDDVEDRHQGTSYRWDVQLERRVIERQPWEVIEPRDEGS